MPYRSHYHRVGGSSNNAFSVAGWVGASIIYADVRLGALLLLRGPRPNRSSKSELPADFSQADGWSDTLLLGCRLTTSPSEWMRRSVHQSYLLGRRERTRAWEGFNYQPVRARATLRFSTQDGRTYHSRPCVTNDGRKWCDRSAMTGIGIKANVYTVAKVLSGAVC